MDSIFVGVLRFDGSDDIDLSVSPHTNKDEAVSEWEELGAEVLEVIEVGVRGTDGKLACTILRSMASTGEGGDVLTTLLEVVVKHQKWWTPPSLK